LGVLTYRASYIHVFDRVMAQGADVSSTQCYTISTGIGFTTFWGFAENVVKKIATFLC